MARWGDAYLHCKGHQRLEQTGGRFPAVLGHAGLQWQVGADSFQQLGQFLQLDTVPPSNPKLTGCLFKPTFPPRATLRKGGGLRKLNSKPLAGGGQQGSVSLLVFATSCFHGSIHRKQAGSKCKKQLGPQLCMFWRGTSLCWAELWSLGSGNAHLWQRQNTPMQSCQRRAASLATTAPRGCTAAHWLEAGPGPPPRSPQPPLP